MAKTSIEKLLKVGARDCQCEICKAARAVITSALKDLRKHDWRQK